MVSAKSAEDGIGRITYVDKKYWALRIDGDSKDRDAAVDAIIKEKDTIQTIAGQHLSILLEDGTDLLIGPSSRVTFTNWRERDGENRLRRTITLHTGMLKAKVRKIYSEDEPFLIVNKFGAVAVRGTEFVVEAGSGGRLEHMRRLTPAEAYDRRHEVEVHVLEGEVYFSPSIENLWKPEKRVTVNAGQSTLVRLGMTRPQPSRYFDLPKFREYVVKAAPRGKFYVTKNTTNEARAIRAANSQSGEANAISPAKPAYAKVHRPTEPGRAIASDGGKSK